MPEKLLACKSQKLLMSTIDLSKLISSLALYDHSVELTKSIPVCCISSIQKMSFFSVKPSFYVFLYKTIIL